MSRVSGGRQSKKRKLKSTYCLIVDGETEEQYFSLLNQRYHWGIKIVKVQPCGMKIISNSKAKLDDACKRSSSQAEHTALVIDKDALTAEECHKLYQEAEYKNIALYMSNIAFEVWLLAHFERVTNGLMSVEQLCKKISSNLTMEYKKGNYKQLERIVGDKHGRDGLALAHKNTEAIATFSPKHQSTDISNLIHHIEAHCQTKA